MCRRSLTTATSAAGIWWPSPVRPDPAHLLPHSRL
jgi:hypothetical protein